MGLAGRCIGPLATAQPDGQSLEGHGSMVVAACRVFLRMSASHSLKDKRQVLRSLTTRVRKDYNVSIAEVGQQDAWQEATVGVACVSSDSAYAHGLLTKVVEAMSNYRLDMEILDFEIEIY